MGGRGQSAEFHADPGDHRLEAFGLSRRFGPRSAVVDVSFRAGAGEVLGLLGPNGAGKTTLLRLLSGLLVPSEGSVRIDGVDLTVADRNTRRCLAYLPESVAPYDEMTVTEYLHFMANVWSLHGATAHGAAAATIERAGLSDVRRRVIGTLSHGFRQRTALAGALVHDPGIVLLDEPTNGLDPRQIVEIRKIIRELADSSLVVLSTHMLAEASQLCDRVLVLDRGRQVGLGTLDELVAATEDSRVRIRLGGAVPDPAAALTHVDGVRVHTVSCDGDSTTIELEMPLDRRGDVVRRIVDCGWDLLELTDVQQPLEDVFLALTS